MLRIERALLTLKGWVESVECDCEMLTVVAGDFKTSDELCEALRSEAAASMTLPWRFTGKDQRFGLGVCLAMPLCSAGDSLWIEVSTGREGEWDAVNPQLLVYRAGKVVCGLDTNHRLIPVEPSGYGKPYDLQMHLYTGMASGDLCVRVRVIRRRTQIWETYHDLRVAVETLKCLPQASEEAAVLYRELSAAIRELRLSTPESGETLESCAQLSNGLETRVYGRESAMGDMTVHAVGHTHIDVAWLWDLKQTQEKVARSFSTALSLQARYPAYKFMASQPVLFEMLEAGQPEVFEDVLKSAARGLWEAEGAMYLEADCNLIGGESLVRQMEWGQKYFKNRFGTVSRVLWLPDVFGYSAALPQILKGFGIELFVTSKISWNDTNQLPVDSFRWRGIDGTEIPTQFITTMSMETLSKGEFKTIYEGNFTPSEVLGSVLRHQQRGVQPNIIMPFGFGDGGGGATETMLETAKRLVKGLPGMPKVTMSFVGEFVEAYQKTPLAALPVWSGELYLEYHRGTYTTNGGIKQRHRQLEDALLMCERLEVALIMVKGSSDVSNVPAIVDPWAYCQPSEMTEVKERAWQKLLLNQFHDILPGTSVKRVYEEAYEQLDDSLDQVKTLQQEYLNSVVDACEGHLTLFNPHGHRMSGPLQIHAGTWESVKGSMALAESEAYRLVGEGWSLPIQCLSDGSAVLYLPDLSPMAMTTFRIESLPKHEEDRGADQPALSNGCQLETKYYNIRINSRGQWISLYDKEAEREILSNGGVGNRLEAFEDRPGRWDAWDIDQDYPAFELSFAHQTLLGIKEHGPLVTVLSVLNRIGQSEVVQDLWFYKDHRRIDVKTTADWHEQQVLLRTRFNLDLHVSEAVYDIQFGHVKRPTDDNHSYHQAQFEVCAAHWGDLSEETFGVALMSNDKFGYNARHGSLGMSLIKSPTWPNEESDQGMHRFTYALYPHLGSLLSGQVHQEAMVFSQPPLAISGKLMAGVTQTMPWIQGLPDHLRLESLRWIGEKRFELRLVSHANVRGTARVSFGCPIEALEKTTLEGREIEKLAEKDGVFAIGYKGFEIITLSGKVPCHTTAI